MITVDPTTPTIAPADYDSVGLGDQVTFTSSAGTNRKTGTVTRMTERRMTVNNTDGTHSYLTRDNAERRQLALVVTATLPDPADALAGYHALYGHVARRAAGRHLGAARAAFAAHDNDALVSHARAAAEILLAAFVSPNRSARAAVDKWISAVVSPGEDLGELLRYVTAIGHLSREIVPRTEGTNTWQVTSKSGAVVGRVEGEEILNARAAVRKTMPRLARAGYGLRRLTVDEL